MVVGYARVSTVEQNLDRQMVALKDCGCDKVFCEKVSGKNTDRKELNNMLSYVREGDMVVVAEFSRLARSTKDLLAIVELLQSKSVNLKSIKEDIDTRTPTGQLLLTVLAAISQFERETILERQKEGIAIAKAKGVYKGRRPKSLTHWDEIYARYQKRELNKTQMASELGISRQTLYRILREKQITL